MVRRKRFELRLTTRRLNSSHQPGRGTYSMPTRVDSICGEK